MQLAARRSLWLVGVLFAVLLLTLAWEGGTAPAGAADQPLISPASGYYENDLLIRMRSPDPQAMVLFTLDGSEPLPENSAVYGRSLPLDANTAGVTVVTARLLWEDGRLGPLTRHTYFQLETSLPILSLAVEPADLADPQAGLLPNPRERGMAWEKPVHVTYLDRTQEETAVVGFTLPAGLRVHGNSSRDYAKKSWRLYFRSEYGESRLRYPLFEPLPYQTQSDGYKRLVLHSGAQEYGTPGWTLLRTPLLEWLAAHTHVAVAPNQHALLFINGEPQGIYMIRQRIDEHYFADVHGVPVLEEAPRDAAWQTVFEQIESQDMRDPTAYEAVIAQINVDSFIDYHLLQLYAANTDWIYANVQEYLPTTIDGRWHWLLWDVDWVFGLAAFNGPEFNMMTRFFENDDPDFLRGSIPLRRLMENPTFRQRFLQRADELLNTILTPEYVLPQLDRLATQIALDVAFEYARWPSSTTWEFGVAEMRDYVEQRPFHFRTHIEAQFGLPSSVPLTLAAPAAGEGQLAIGDWLTAANWSGRYFVGTAVQITAVPVQGYRFAGWEEPNLPSQPVLNWEVAEAQTFTPRFERLPRGRWQADDVIITAAGSGEHLELNVSGDWVELQVQRRGGVDLRGWRLTDSDTKTAVDEGNLTFADLPALADVPFGTRLLIIRADEPLADQTLPSGLRLLVVGNGQVSSNAPYRFRLAEQDSVALLAPGETAVLADDVGIAFHLLGVGLPSVTPASFGVLADGVTTGMMGE